jgi:hypothetical protein
VRDGHLAFERDDTPTTRGVFPVFFGEITAEGLDEELTDAGDDNG